jgi:tetratricopeptide (TPR) repeat protein
MSVASPSQPVEKSQEPTRVDPQTAVARVERSIWATRAFDGSLIVLFLILTFLLGAFPLKDADIYWHLRTGDLIRQTGKVPQTDIFTFMREGTPWIDLHWIFQVGISWLHERGGVPALTVAKCAITCLAMLILVSARKREWPIPVMVLAWLPALFVLGGRIYIRPETLTLLYLSVFLAAILRWERYPLLAFLLPVVEVAWVNSQGLFVLGPVILAFGLIDAVLRLGIFAPERRRWWKLILAASVATGLACLINPYGIRGALYPIELAGTMSNPIFARNVAELTSIADFIRSDGLGNLSLQLHLAAMLIGGLSFLIPLGWQITVSMRADQGRAALGVPDRPATGATESPGRSKKKRSRPKGAGAKAAKVAEAADSNTALAAIWRLSPFRLLLFAAFSFLSLQATRNSHQFGAVVGTVTAWNFGEWAAAIRRRRQMLPPAAPSRWAIPARPLAFAALAVLVLWVGSGRYFRMTGEGRTIGFGEDALWFPHEAAKFAGKEGMPSRFLSFHNGHAALFEYYHGPERKVYIDPRLEVAGADLFRRYTDLELRIKKDTPGWEAELAEMGLPVILSDHLYNSKIVGTLLRSDHWRCVWFDAIVAVFVHDSFRTEVRADAVDFAARHFGPGPSKDSRDRAELVALTKAIARYMILLGPSEGEKTRPLAWLGLDAARAILRQEPDSLDGWINMGVIELFREMPREPVVARFRAPFDPIYDLSSVRATYALRHALQLEPGNALAANMLKIAYDSRLMHEAALALLDRIKQSGDGQSRADYERKMGVRPTTEWRNVGDLDQVMTALLASGRALSTVAILEKASGAEHAPWDMADRIATLRLHLGEPARARAAWESAVEVPEPAIREARIGTTYLAENDFESARKHYGLALEAKPELFEPLYCLAVLEADAGDAGAAFALAKKAVASAPNEASRSAARLMATRLARFARPVMELAGAGLNEAGAHPDDRSR